MARGRKPHGNAEMLLMAEISVGLKQYRKTKEWDVKTAAKELGVSTKSFYKYESEDDVPRFEILQKLHEWGIVKSLDRYQVKALEERRKRRPKTPEGQLLLPFIEALRQEDVEILKVIPRKPNAVELLVKIKFAGRQ